MKLEHTKINFLGDSITEGVGVSAPEKRFSDLLKEICGLDAARNYGISGTRIARQKTPSENSRFDLDFCMRVSEMDADADAVVVFGGTNDFGHGDSVLGSFGNTDPHTFYGGCLTLCEELLERFPGKVIVLCTPMHRLTEDACNHNGVTLEAYVNILREVARFYSLPVLDLYAISGIQPRVAAIRERFCPDGLHPNDAGHVLLAQRMEAFLRGL